MSRFNLLHGAFAVVTTLVLSAPAHALAFRTYLASYGVDGPACSLPSPCRLLPAALAAVADGGEIWMLDSANYNTGPVNITKSVTVLAIPGALGSLVANGGDAISMTTAGVKVVLRNLVIVPLPGGGGTNGIAVQAATSLTVDGCLIANHANFGIIVTGLVSDVHVMDSTIRDNADTGMWLLGGTQATITRSTITGNAGTGIFVLNNYATLSRVDIADSTLSANGNGLLAWSEAGGPLHLSIHGSRIVRNAMYGVSTKSTGAVVWVTVSGNIISNNGTGVRSLDAPTRVVAFGNIVSGNGVGFERGTGVFETSGHNTVQNNTTNTVGVFTPVSTM